MSRVVPLIDETIDLSLLFIRLNKLDLPVLGGPKMTRGIPDLISLKTLELTIETSIKSFSALILDFISF